MRKEEKKWGEVRYRQETTPRLRTPSHSEVWWVPRSGMSRMPSRLPNYKLPLHRQAFSSATYALASTRSATADMRTQKNPANDTWLTRPQARIARSSGRPPLTHVLCAQSLVPVAHLSYPKGVRSGFAECAPCQRGTENKN